MAKKKQEMTPEERLTAALVPESEQPYQLPKGWKWVRLGGLNDYKSTSINPLSTPDETFELYSVPSIVDNYPEITKGMNIGSTKQLVEKDDVLLCKINPRINRVWKVSSYTTHQCLASSEWIIIRARPFFVADYLMWFFRCPYFRKLMLSNVSGVGGSLMRAKPRYVQAYPIALPSQSEQQRIVSRIESLFAKLDAAKEKVQAVFDAHEMRKAALLQDAFAGKLTAKWRKEYEIDAPAYRNVALAEVCDSIFDGDHMPPPKSSSGIPFLVISNVNTGKLNFSDTRFVPQDYYDALTDTRKPQNGDVLYTLVGTYGIPVLVDTDRAFCFQRHMALLKLKKDVILQRYLWYALQEKNFYRKATKIAKGTAQLTVPIKGLRQLTIPMASLLEQQEIVRILDRLLGREEQVRQSAESVLETIDRMKQSILARAFRGEL
ncbi:restriction endonuclease subunit S [uncultured Mitsuokella sp.]|uniref:restriction endonuclease subunit S n=1 Tax=uncultured Mitsuokella sp. TaxID=453120 RepID=UPI00262C4FCF|nr:restriction endonuclease subunit S [uncultured Mitsuokella sp.]